jgi:hypothetical protein
MLSEGSPDTVGRQEGCANKRAETTVIRSPWTRLLAAADIQMTLLRRLAVTACGIAVGSAAGGPVSAHVDELCSWTLSVLQVMHSCTLLQICGALSAADLACAALERWHIWRPV